MHGAATTRKLCKCNLIETLSVADREKWTAISRRNRTLDRSFSARETECTHTDLRDDEENRNRIKSRFTGPINTVRVSRTWRETRNNVHRCNHKTIIQFRSSIINCLSRPLRPSRFLVAWRVPRKLGINCSRSAFSFVAHIDIIRWPSIKIDFAFPDSPIPISHPVICTRLLASGCMHDACMHACRSDVVKGLRCVSLTV